MSKFGEIINTDVPVLINFYANQNESSEVMHSVIRYIAAMLGDKAKVVKIDIDKNQDLAEALRVHNVPAFMIYKNGQMVWRQSGESDAESIIAVVQKYIS